MKLYDSPACSLAPHIALVESGVSYDLVRVGRAPGQGSCADGCLIG